MEKLNKLEFDEKKELAKKEKELAKKSIQEKDIDKD